MEERFDVVIIGGGLLGCFAARNLSRFDLKIAVIEKNPDVCMEISKANTAIVYDGYNTAPGTLKAELCLRANRDFARLCDELGVRFNRCGSLMVAFGERGIGILQKKYEQGLLNGITDLRILTADEITALEPNIDPGVKAALYSPSIGTVNPWELCIAAAENSAANGVRFFFNTKITAIKRISSGFLLKAAQKTIAAKAVVNCAGLFTDEISDLVAAPYFRIIPSKGDYMVLDNHASGFINHIIFHEPEKKGKGGTFVPTVDGNILLGPSKGLAYDRHSFSTTAEGLDFVKSISKTIFPKLPMEHVIRSFAALRPNMYYIKPDDSGNYVVADRKINNFIIEESPNTPGFINAVGIKTPGLTCANEIGAYIADMVIKRLGSVRENRSYQPRRQKPVRFSDLSADEQQSLVKIIPDFGNIVCRCRTVTEAEIISAIHKIPGATTLDGVKRRTGAGMGRCQGGYCAERIIELLAKELGKPVSEIEKDRKDSWMIKEASLNERL